MLLEAVPGLGAAFLLVLPRRLAGVDTAVLGRAGGILPGVRHPCGGSLSLPSCLVGVRHLPTLRFLCGRAASCQVSDTRVGELEPAELLIGCLTPSTFLLRHLALQVSDTRVRRP